MQKNWTTCVEIDEKGRTKYSIRYETLNEQEFNELKAMVDSFYRTHEVVSAIKNGGNSEWIEIIKPTELEDCPEAYYRCKACGCSVPFYVPFCPECGKLMCIKYRFGWTDGERVMGIDALVPVMYTTQEELEVFYKKVTGFDYDSKSCSIQINVTGGEIE